MERKVYIFLDSSAAGGIESHVLILARSLSMHCRVEVLLWRQYQAPHPLLAQLTAAGVPCQDMNGRLWNLVLLLARTPAAVLHCHGYKANIIGRLVTTFLSAHCVCTFHNGDVGEGLVRLYTWFDELTSPLSSNIAVSQQIAARLHKHCVQIPNVVDTERAVYLSGESRGPVAFVGRLEQVKRPDRFCQLADAFPQQSFAIWGHGSLFAELQQRKMVNVSLKGGVASMQEYWATIDLLVICSECEGMPMVALEAMAAGVPVLTLPLGDLPRLVQHQCNGFIAADPMQLSVWLAQWYEMSTAQRLTMRQQARLTVQQRFSTNQLWPALRQIYQAERG